MPRHFALISQIDLAKKIIDAYTQLLNKNPHLEPLGTGAYIEEALSLTCYRCLTPKIEEDLSKVMFDTENVDTDGYCYRSIAGFRTLNNGLTYLGVGAGGDWEEPIFFIIYWNGVSLRGYIPKLGNMWNYDTKQALGNDHNEDEAFFRKVLKNDYNVNYIDNNPELLFNTDLIIQNIQQRIKGPAN
jgi:hypothetical protein